MNPREIDPILINGQNTIWKRFREIDDMETTAHVVKRGERVHLTPLQLKNLYKHFEWNNDPELNRFDSEIPFAEESLGDFKARFEQMVYDPSPTLQDARSCLLLQGDCYRKDRKVTRCAAAGTRMAHRARERPPHGKADLDRFQRHDLQMRFRRTFP